MAPAAVTGEPITRRRRWGAALGGTIVLVFAFAAVVTAIVEQDRGNPRRAAAAAIAAAALVPVVFTVLARVSRAPRPMRAVLLATPPASKTVLIPYCCAARRVFSTSTSITAA